MSGGAPFQLFPALDAATEAALRFSIERFGVLVPVVRDQHGRILDGYHRSRIADELGVPYRVDVITVADDDQAAEIARTLNADRRHLSVEQRREVVRALREQGHSTRAIAGVVKVDQKTVWRDLNQSTEASASVEPDRVLGLDGKSRPARRPVVVAAKNEREAQRAQAALADLTLPNVPVLDVKRAERLAREQAAAQRRTMPVEPTTADGIVEIRHGNFRHVLADLSGQAAAIITDPPYTRGAHDDYPALAAQAARLLTADGALVVMTGTRPEAWLPLIPAMNEHLPLRWIGCYLTAGPAWRDHSAKVATNWKPLLIFGNGPSLNSDVFRSTGDDKQHHRWGQNEHGIAAIVQAFTNPGDLVVDPFLGGGTTAVVCQQLGRRFVGCDVDAAAVAATRERVSAVA